MASTSKSSDSAPLESHLAVSCDVCEKKFPREYSKRRHMRDVHKMYHIRLASTGPPLESQLLFSCNICKKKFTTEYNKLRHMRNVHKILSESKKNLKCSECLNMFASHSSFMKHVTESHPEIEIKKEVWQFPDVNSFELWKSDIEKKTASKYILKKNYKNKKGRLLKYYICHRSGVFTSHSKGIRRLKEGGSYKINSYCPSRIVTVTSIVQDDCKLVVAEHYSTHIGHDCDISYIRSSKSEKNDLKNVSELPTEIPSDDYSCASDRGGDYSNSSDRGETLEIITDKHLEQKTREENAIAVEMIKESSNLEKLKEDLKWTVLDFMPLIEDIENEKTCKKMLASLTSLKNTCIKEAKEIQDEQLPSIVARNASTKKKGRQPKYHEKKKRACVTKTNHTQDDVVLQEVLLYSEAT